MARRRLSLGEYVRRRWRALGAIAVLLLGALLVLGVTDRGHDPLWQARADGLDAPAMAPDGRAVYALLRTGENVTGVAAYDGDDGRLRWTGDLNATRALLAAGPSGALVAKDFPGALLTSYNADGAILWQVPVEGNPIALAVDGDFAALALNAPTNPVLVYEGPRLVATLRNPSPLRAMDMQDGLVAAGGIHGQVLVWQANGTQTANVTLPMSIRSLRLSDDGTTLLVGGARPEAVEQRGMLALLDTSGEVEIRWQTETTGPPVGLVDLDAHGLVALAVEDAPPTTTVHAYDAATGATRWAARIDGSVSRDDAGSSGGAALSPNGDIAVVSTLRGEVVAYDATDGSVAWTYRAAGATSIAFADGSPDRVLVGARMIENRPADTLLLFSADDEPLWQRAGLVAIALSLLAAAAFALVLGVGFWRARRSY